MQCVEFYIQSFNEFSFLGAAKTGSGKTLAFLIPLIEKLYTLKWTPTDGLGALVITPTRELAYQIFETLKKIGKYHDFSAGLVIGGKDLKYETDRLSNCNIIICTPGKGPFIHILRKSVFGLLLTMCTYHCKVEKI